MVSRLLLLFLCVLLLDSCHSKLYLNGTIEGNRLNEYELLFYFDGRQQQVSERDLCKVKDLKRDCNRTYGKEYLKGYGAIYDFSSNTLYFSVDEVAIYLKEGTRKKLIAKTNFEKKCENRIYVKVHIGTDIDSLASPVFRWHSANSFFSENLNDSIYVYSRRSFTNDCLDKQSENIGVK